MKFETVNDLIVYLINFNPHARLLTDMSFSWSKSGCSEEYDSGLTTNILYVYGDYNPYYEDNQNYYRIKDFIIHNYFDEYDDFVSCFLCFEEDSVEYYLKHKNYWGFDKKNSIRRKIMEGIHNFCEEKQFDDLKPIYVFITQEMFE